MKRFKAEQGPRSVWMETRTVRHSKWDNLDNLKDRLKRARRWYKGHRVYKGIRAELGATGTIRALEVTHGANGWHPHEHELWFCESAKSDSAMADAENGLAELWRQACMRVGLPATNEHGLTLRGAEYAVDYLAKWGAAEELSKSHLKKGRNGSRTPWDLLRDSADGDREAGRLWTHFAASFKGERQLYWAPGLRKRLGATNERDDQDVAENSDDPVTTVAVIFTAGGPMSDWGLVRHFRAFSVVLEAAESRGSAGVAQVLAELRRRRFAICPHKQEKKPP